MYYGVIMSIHVVSDASAISAVINVADAISFYRRQGFERVDNSQELLAAYWEVPQWQAAKSLVMEKKLAEDLGSGLTV